MPNRTISRSRPSWSVRIITPLALLASGVACASTVSVVGVPHFSALDPEPTAAHRNAAIERLARFEPSLVCVEAMPGERVEAFSRDPARHGELLQTFSIDAVRLAGEQQIRLQMSAAAARDEARTLVASETLDSKARLRLIGLQIAAYEPWSAVLNWTYLDAGEREGGNGRLGKVAVQRLEQLESSINEISSLAIPLARRHGHRQLCAVDAFVDEAAVQTLADGLMPLLQQPGIMDAFNALQQESASQWTPSKPGALVDLLLWHNIPEFATKDAAAQWTIFARGTGHDAGKRRLMLWHARNAEIVTHLFRAMAQPDGARVMLVIGGAHRPFIEAAIRAQPWTELVDARTLLAP